jgi:hypothetical protein
MNDQNYLLSKEKKIRLRITQNQSFEIIKISFHLKESKQDKSKANVLKTTKL